MHSKQSQVGAGLPAEAEMPPPAPTGKSIFRREGEYWTIVHHGTVLRLRDTKSLRYLAYLLRHPGERIPAQDLERSEAAPIQPESTTDRGSPIAASHERARLAVTKRIKSAIHTIHEHYPALGYHFSVSIKTGAQCIYIPDPQRPIVWTD